MLRAHDVERCRVGRERGLDGRGTMFGKEQRGHVARVVVALRELGGSRVGLGGECAHRGDLLRTRGRDPGARGIGDERKQLARRVLHGRVELAVRDRRARLEQHEVGEALHDRDAHARVVAVAIGVERAERQRGIRRPAGREQLGLREVQLGELRGDARLARERDRDRVVDAQRLRESRGDVGVACRARLVGRRERCGASVRSTRAKARRPRVRAARWHTRPAGPRRAVRFEVVSWSIPVNGERRANAPDGSVVHARIGGRSGGSRRVDACVASCGSEGASATGSAIANSSRSLMATVAPACRQPAMEPRQPAVARFRLVLAVAVMVAVRGTTVMAVVRHPRRRRGLVVVRATRLHCGERGLDRKQQAEQDGNEGTRFHAAIVAHPRGSTKRRDVVMRRFSLHSSAAQLDCRPCPALFRRHASRRILIGFLALCFLWQPILLIAAEVHEAQHLLQTGHAHDAEHPESGIPRG